MLDIKERKEGEFVVLGLAGRLETKTSHEFEKKVIELLSSGSRRFVVDLKETEYVSSAGLRVLLMLSKKLNGTGGHLALCSMSEAVRQVFDIAGFAAFFLIADSPAQAMTRAAPAPRLPKAARPAAASAPKPSEGSKILEQAARALGVGPAETKAAAEDADSGTAAKAAELFGVKPSPDKKKS